MWLRRGIAAGLLLSAACTKAPPAPTERRPLIATAEAPLLKEAEDDEPAADIARAGEVVELVRELYPLRWEAKMGQTTGKRDGLLVQVRQAPGEGIFFGFKSDFGPEADVPLVPWICAAMAADPSLPAAARRPNCNDRLRRFRMQDGAFAVYLICSEGPCPIGIVRDGHVAAIAVEGMVSARTVVEGGGGLGLLASTRWARSDGKWTGGALVPVELSGAAPVALPEIPLDDIDARDPTKVVARVVKTTIDEKEPLAVHIVGARTETTLADNRELSRVPIDERVPLGLR
jgi:hypothetical protein